MKPIFLLTLWLISTACFATEMIDVAPASSDKRSVQLPADKNAQDWLPAWRDTRLKEEILRFVQKTSQPDSPDFIPEEERIAVFDNDGTLWSEQPVYVQLAFTLDRVKALAHKNPQWKTEKLFQSALKKDLKTLFAAGEKGLLTLVIATHTNMSNERFQAQVNEWMSTARHPTTGRLYTEMVYQPMLELIQLLHANRYKVFIVSGGGAEFIRPWVEKTYGIPQDRVIGSGIRTRYEVIDGQPQLTRLPKLEFINDKAGKPVGIQRHVGRRPVIAVGNSDGDLQMLQWTSAGKGARLALLLHHTDAEREVAYDRHSAIGRLDKALELAPQSGWHIIDMKKEWHTVFPPVRNIAP